MNKRVGASALARFVFGAVCLVPCAATADDEQIPDLGTIRYRDPHQARMLWLGLDVGGAYIPESFGLFDRTVWTVRTTPAWALALTQWLSLGGRHGLAWYDGSATSVVRLRIHEHQFEVSGRPLASRPGVRMADRLAAGVSLHSIENISVDGAEFRVGGLKDTILHVGYGIEHPLGRRWALGWNVQLRHAWVFLDTQRQLRASVRGVVRPRPPHELRLQAALYAVHRDENQAGNPLPRGGAYGQFTFDYVWMSRHGVGTYASARFATTFLSGEAPVYEIREEALNNLYGDLTVGFRAAWGPP